MTKIKIGITLLTSVILGGLVLGAAVFANPYSDKNEKSNNGRAEYVQNEILVKFQGDDKPFRVVKVPRGKVEEKVKEYKGKANVVYAEPNYILYAFDAPADPLYADWQWALNNTGQDLEGRINGTPGADINWEQAWTEFKTTTFSPTIIAILDSGIDASHPDLTNKLVPGKNFTDDGGENETQDVYGHGTHVAGIAGAETNNSVETTGGIAGVAFPANIKIMSVKVLGNNGCSDSGSVADGIYYAADPTRGGAKVINLSLGGRGSETMKTAINYAYGKGVLIAAAAGNDGAGRKRYPASYPNVMSVAGTDYNDNNYSWSNFNDEIDISAPAVKVLSTIMYHANPDKDQEYGLGTGTSMACPHVAGLAGLLFAQDNTRTNTDVRAIIEQSADDLGDTGWDKHFGHGRINVHAALTYSACETNNDCESGKICCLGKCIVSICTTGGNECDDGEICTTDTCINPGTCEASCTNTWFACGIADGCCGPECTSETDIDCSPSECVKNGRYCNCNGKCDKFESFESCPSDCPKAI